MSHGISFTNDDTIRLSGYCSTSAYTIEAATMHDAAIMFLNKSEHTNIVRNTMYFTTGGILSAALFFESGASPRNAALLRSEASIFAPSRGARFCSELQIVLLMLDASASAEHGCSAVSFTVMPLFIAIARSAKSASSIRCVLNITVLPVRANV